MATRAASRRRLARRARAAVGVAVAVAPVGMVALTGAAETDRHTVEAGETLSGIAVDHGTSVQALAGANGIADPNRIIAGQVLVLPSPGTGAPVAPAPATTYTVRPGDNLASIARRFGVTTAALAQANGIANPNLIVIGKVLTIPSAPAGAGATHTGSLPARLQASPSRLALRPVFEQWAANYGVPADLLEALCWMESGWQNTVVSSTGAVGIGQLMPDTITFIRSVLGPLDASVPADNIRMSAWFLSYLLRQTNGNTGMAVASYYQGLGSVTSGRLLDETKHYVTVVLALRPYFS